METNQGQVNGPGPSSDEQSLLQRLMGMPSAASTPVQEGAGMPMSQVNGPGPSSNEQSLLQRFMGMPSAASTSLQEGAVMPMSQVNGPGPSSNDQSLLQRFMGMPSPASSTPVQEGAVMPMIQVNGPGPSGNQQSLLQRLMGMPSAASTSLQEGAVMPMIQVNGPGPSGNQQSLLQRLMGMPSPASTAVQEGAGMPMNMNLLQQLLNIGSTPPAASHRDSSISQLLSTLGISPAALQEQQILQQLLELQAAPPQPAQDNLFELLGVQNVGGSSGSALLQAVAGGALGSRVPASTAKRGRPTKKEAAAKKLRTTLLALVSLANRGAFNPQAAVQLAPASAPVQQVQVHAPATMAASASAPVQVDAAVTASTSVAPATAEDSGSDDCLVCRKLRCPSILQCGHHVCENCLLLILDGPKHECPETFCKHPIASARDLVTIRRH